MSRRPFSPRAVAAAVIAVLVVAVVVGTLAYLHRAAPRLEEDFLVEGAEEQHGLGEDVIECQRRLPGQQQVDVGEDVGEDAGRLLSSEVVACPDFFDGRIVQYLGEVVGDVLERDGGAWVLMNDDAYALESGPLPAHEILAGTNTGLTVWLPGDDVEERITPGRPNVRGDVILARGRLLRADPADGGGLTLRADEFEVVEQAQPAPPPFRRAQAAFAAFVALVTLAVVGYERRYHQA